MAYCSTWLLLFGMFLLAESVTGYYCPDTAISSGDVRYYKCLTISETQASWLDALSACEADGGTLARIENQEQQDYIAKYMSQKDYHWFGVNDIKEEAAFVNTDQLPVTWFNWDPRSPQPNGADGQNCTAVNKRYQWEDKECENLYYYICEAIATGEPVKNVFNPNSKYLSDGSTSLGKPETADNVELMTRLSVEDESFCIMFCLHNPDCAVVAFGPGKTPYNCQLYKTMLGGYAPLWLGWYRYQILEQ